VIRHANAREILYSNTWNALVIDANVSNSGFTLGTPTAAAYYEFTFFGTGVEIQSQANTGAIQNMTVAIDGSSNFSSYTSSLIASGTGMTWTASTGAIAGTTSAVTAYNLRIYGLPLAKHTLRVTRNGNDIMYVNAIDVITPVHAQVEEPAR
jgi:hypothetical protein